ncbi:hypothetical protein F5051DRAFT_445576 [Lentinula edodes]|nr:hypothetical protein F5051DRAFT_445576 [Lentinula edodes]
MSLRRARSQTSLYSQARLTAQLSRRLEEVEELHRKLSLKSQALGDAEKELDNLMNSESQRIQFLESERKQVYTEKTEAEIKVERLQRRVDELETELQELRKHTNSGSGLTPDTSLTPASEAMPRLCDAEATIGSLLGTEDKLKADLEKQGTSNTGGDGAGIPGNAEGGFKGKLTHRSSELVATHSLQTPRELDAQLPEAEKNIGFDVVVCTPEVLQNTEEEAMPSINSVQSEICGTIENLVTAQNVLVDLRIELPCYPEDASKSKNALLWFHPAFEYLNHDLGVDYIYLIRAWIKLERIKDWVYSSKGISAKLRPKELSHWIANCRYDRRNNDPKFQKQDINRFGINFVTWWNSLVNQISTVSGENSDGDGRVRKEWGTLNTSGKNGWLSIIVCLKWWGMGLRDDREGALGVKWRCTIKEVSCVLNELNLYLSTN